MIDGVIPTFVPGSKREYKKLKKYPSYTDEYELISKVISHKLDKILLYIIMPIITLTQVKGVIIC